MANILALKMLKKKTHCLNVAITYPSVTDEGRCNYVRMTPLTSPDSVMCASLSMARYQSLTLLLLYCAQQTNENNLLAFGPIPPTLCSTFDHSTEML